MAAPAVLLPCDDPAAWAKAQELVLKPRHTSFPGLAKAIAVYSGLTDSLRLWALERHIAELGTDNFFTSLLPFIQEQALSLPAQLEGLQGRTLPLLMPNIPATLEVPRPLVASLLACAFFGLYADRRTTADPAPDVPEVNWLFLLASCPGHVPFVVHYFRRLQQAAPVGVIRITRKVLPAPLTVADWKAMAVPLSPVVVHLKGGIEDAEGVLEADFANKYLGGGVLSGGNVQEEIRFLLSPECLAGLLVCPCMEPLEAIEIFGVERFSRHGGYGGSLKWEADYQDPHKAPDGQPLTTMVAFDALVSPRGEEYSEAAKLRELSKAYAAFRPKPDETPVLPIATGHWGCGVFGGCKSLKFVLQWMAASRAGRPMEYFVFGDEWIAKEIAAVIEAVQQSAHEPFTVGRLAGIVFANEWEMRREFLTWVTKQIAN